MQVNRFWGSVGSVAAYLFGVGLLQHVIAIVITLFGLVPVGPARILVELAAGIVPLVGTLTYIDWRWGWEAEHIGMPFRVSAVTWLFPGLLLGALASLVAYIGSGGLRLGLPSIPPLTPELLLGAVVLLLGAFSTEVVFRGAVISRYRADLTRTEALGAAVLTPFIWLLLSSFVGIMAPATGLSTTPLAAMSVFLSLLFFRTDSVWLSVGLRGGALLLVMLLGDQITPNGQLLVWGTAAVVMIVWEMLRQQRMPKRVVRSNRGKTIRGPWGPH